MPVDIVVIDKTESLVFFYFFSWKLPLNIIIKKIIMDSLVPYRWSLVFHKLADESPKKISCMKMLEKRTV